MSGVLIILGPLFFYEIFLLNCDRVGIFLVSIGRLFYDSMSPGIGDDFNVADIGNGMVKGLVFLSILVAVFL